MIENLRSRKLSSDVLLELSAWKKRNGENIILGSRNPNVMYCDRFRLMINAFCIFYFFAFIVWSC